MGGGLIKGTVASASTFVWEKAISPPACTLILETSAPPHMSLVPFELLPQCWSLERVSQSKSMCVDPLRKTPGTPEALCVTKPQFPLVLTARSYGTSHPSIRTLDLGAWCESGILGASEASTAKISLPIFIYYMWVWDLPVPHLCFSYQP